MDTVARHLHISGQVQGVNYRNACRREARSLKVTGWVRNCPDGSVEAHAQGTPSAVEQLIDWCHRGPAHARVEQVRVEEVDVGTFGSFDVR